MTFTIKQNDTAPSLQAVLKDPSGTPIFLAGAFVRFHMKSVSGTLKISSPVTIVDANNGLIRYDWEIGDTDTAGSFYAEFQVTYADGNIETFPNNGYESITITKELN